tara:strand:+ start:1827 stop:2063 length:237 start_codon:yes stop_codon:yes gene_type:complete
MINLKDYKNILGAAGTGIHKYKFMGTSLVDYFMSIVGAFIITYYTKVPLVITTIGILLVGILLHWLFQINTEVLKFIS